MIHADADEILDPPSGAPAAVLHLLGHPGTVSTSADALARRDAACDWLRGIARACQAALVPGLQMAEVRAKDLRDGADDLLRAVQRLLLPGSTPVEALPFLRDPPPVARPCPGPEVAAIATDIAGDPGYLWTDTPGLA